MVIKNLENKIKLVGIICTAFLVGCVIISVSSIWTYRTMVTDAQKKVYVLDGNVPILVRRTTMEETLDVEAKSHVEMFHHYFFTLAPDDKYIRYTMEKAMYLVDETGLAQYNTLKEKGFYSNILGTSAVFSIFCDSITFNKEKMEFTYYGRQRIERRSNIPMRELVTAGQLKRVPRTENNPHGLLIVNWRTLLNKDIEQKTKATINSTSPMNIKGFRRMLFGEKMPDKTTEIQGALRTRRGCRATLRQSDTYRQGSGQSTGFRQRPPDAVSRHRIRLRHLRADMEYLPRRWCTAIIQSAELPRKCRIPCSGNGIRCFPYRMYEDSIRRKAVRKAGIERQAYEYAV